MDVIETFIDYRKREPILFYAFVSIPVIAIIYFLIWTPIDNSVQRQKLNKASATLKNNLHMYQLGIERYCVDTEGVYPPNLDVVVDKGYIEEYLPNPYYGLVDGAPPKMLPVRAGHFIPGSVVYETTDYFDSYALIAQGWWVAGRHDDVEALTRFAPPLTYDQLDELRYYLSSGGNIGK
jgi:hypothetical protein